MITIKYGPLVASFLSQVTISQKLRGDLRHTMSNRWTGAQLLNISLPNRDVNLGVAEIKSTFGNRRSKQSYILAGN